MSTLLVAVLVAIFLGALLGNIGALAFATFFALTWRDLRGAHL